MRGYANAVKRGFDFKKSAGVGIFTIPSFEEYGFKHCFSTRIGGVSKNEFASLNLSKTRENNAENKKENYERVCRAIGVDYGSLTLVNYEHGVGVHCAAAEDAGKGVSRETDFPHCDAIITDVSDVTAVTLHADCVPVFMADTKKRVAGVAHAGWKGTLLGIVPKMADVFMKQYGSAPEDMIVGIGPHIMECCFEVKSDVAVPFIESYGDSVVNKKDDGMYLDLQAVLLAQLERTGILPQKVTCADMCTYCNPDLFYSHRRDNGKTGAMGSFITV